MPKMARIAQSGHFLSLNFLSTVLPFRVAAGSDSYAIALCALYWSKPLLKASLSKAIEGSTACCLRAVFVAPNATSVLAFKLCKRRWNQEPRYEMMHMNLPLHLCGGLTSTWRVKRPVFVCRDEGSLYSSTCGLWPTLFLVVMIAPSD